MSHSISRKAFLLSLAAGSTLFFPSPAEASDSVQGEGTDRLVVEQSGDFVTIFDTLTGEWISFSGVLSTDGDELLLNRPFGVVSALSWRDGWVYLDDVPMMTAPVDVSATRACVELSHKRFKVHSEGKALLDLAASIAATVGMPYAKAVAAVMALHNALGWGSTEYVETISYYCDSPTPRMRYVTNYYTDSSYTKIKYTTTGDSEFINPRGA